MLFEEYEEWTQNTDSVKEKLGEYEPGFPFGASVLDAEPLNDGTGGTRVWVEFLKVDPKDIANLEGNYAQAENQFKTWCEDNGLAYDQITTTEDSVTFIVTM